MNPETMQEALPDVKELVRIIGQVLAGDYSERPELMEAEDDFGLLVLLVRFLIDDLEDTRQGRRDADQTQAEVQRYKQVFLQSAGQEMHTPLTPIRMQLHMLRKDAEEGKLDRRQSRGIDIIDRNLTRLLVIMQELVEVNGADASGAPLRRQAFDVPELVHARLEDFGEMARSRNIQLASELQPSLLASVDVQRMAEVIDALLSNALQFTPDGGFVIVRCMRRGHEILVEIQDSGIGIEPDDARVIFEPNGQGRTRSLHGDLNSGLGLFGCKRTIERHGGLLWCASDGTNQGSTFSFALPLVGGTNDVPAV